MVGIESEKEYLNATAVIIPAFNEEFAIQETVTSLAKYFSHIVVVDDGSSDNTAAGAAFLPGCNVVRHCMNIGQGGALMTGIQWALHSSAKYFVTFDADGQHRPEDAVKMLQYLVSANKDIVLGSRFLATPGNMPFSKKCLLKMACLLSRIMHGLNLTDAHNGLRVFNRIVAQSIDFKSYDMAHASEIYDIIAKNKYKYAEFPVVINYSAYSKAKGQSLFNAINILVDFILQKVR